MTRILVVKLGALGDFVLAFGPFAAIRAQHPGAEITLLTAPAFAGLARAAPWFDRVVTDTRAPPWHIPALLRLRRALRGFDRVYDLQTSSRSGWYFRLAGRPVWSGIAPGCALPHANPARDRMHTLERQREQLVMAGLTRFPVPDFGWLSNAPPAEPFPAGGKGQGEDGRPAEEFVRAVVAGRRHPHPDPLPPAGEGDRYAALIPGAAPHRPRKRWPSARFGELAALLAARGQTPVVVGTGEDAGHAAVIRAACPAAIDLTGRTTLLQLGGVLGGAALAVGNDTGPTHLAAALGIPTIALFSDSSDPALTRPRGDVTVLAAADLADLSVQRVAAALPQVHGRSPIPLEAL